MPINKHYHPNYRALYPGEELTTAVLTVLHRSDRKMEYMEYELKHSRVRKDRDGEVISITPPREDSLERLQELNRQFAGASPSPEQVFFKREDRQALHRALSMLGADERALIEALFYNGLTEREYAAKIGRAQQSVNERKQRILEKLKTFIEKG